MYDLLRSDLGRTRFWVERSHEDDGIIEFGFPNGMTSRAQVLDDVPNERLSLCYLGSRVTFLLRDAPDGCELEVLDEGVAPAHRTDVAAGWVSVLLALKAYAVHGADLRNHHPARTWDQRYVDN